jgi:prepilin-type N-terminal cleavage/methylation domain-containing protein
MTTRAFTLIELMIAVALGSLIIFVTVAGVRVVSGCFDA